MLYLKKKKKKRNSPLQKKKKKVHLFAGSGDTKIFNISLQTVLSGGFANWLLNQWEFGMCIRA